jgi:choline kinase
MKAIILAAGRGSRMGGLTDTQPKGLVSLRGKPLLEWQLASLRAAGIHEIALVTGYRHEALSPYGLPMFHNPDWRRTNMVTSLACAREWLQAEACIVSYSDIFYEANAVGKLMDSDAAFALTYDPDWLRLWQARFDCPLSDAETFRVSDGGRLLEIGSKPSSVEEVQGQYMGLLRFTPAGWAMLERLRASLDDSERDSLHMTGAIQRALALDTLPITAIPYTGKWGEVDSASDLALYESLALP